VRRIFAFERTITGQSAEQGRSPANSTDAPLLADLRS
jgi:hypothetical protein